MIAAKALTRASTILLATSLLTSCAEKWKLMPTPVVHQQLGARAFSKLTPEELSQDIDLLYATNRPSKGPAESREYTNGIVDKVHMGVAKVTLGEPGLNWRDVVDLSVLRDRKEEVPLNLGDAQELDSLPDTSGKTFASMVNQKLARSETKDVTIYVHGAKSTFLRSVVQGAQFYHFMTRDTAFIAFSWPSTGKFLSYDKDVEFAAQSAPAMADFVEYLAENTNAKSINLLAYSAGAQVVPPALALLATRNPGESAASIKRRLRIGDIYLAAADVGMKKFVNEYLPAFSEIVDNTTLTFHKEDFVLKISQGSHDGETRLGRPDSGELNDEEISWLEGLAREGKLDILDMEYSTADRPVDFKAHGHWYLNSWVSSDAILQFLYRPNPGARGLVKKPDSEVWYFPADYPERIAKIIEESDRE